MALVKIITGTKDSGKTTAAQRIIAELGASGQRVAGFISEAEYVGGKKDIYFIRDITTGRRAAAVSAVKTGDGWRKYDFSRYWFSDEAFAFSAEIIETVIIDYKNGCGPDLAVIDELGPLELAGQGHFLSVSRLLKSFDNMICLVIRETVLGALLDKLDIDLENTEIIRPSR